MTAGTRSRLAPAACMVLTCCSLLESDHSGFNFLKYARTSASTSVCCTPRERISLCPSPRPNSHPFHVQMPMISLCVDSVIHSRLWSPSIRARAHLTSTSKPLVSHRDLETCSTDAPASCIALLRAPSARNTITPHQRQLGLSETPLPLVKIKRPVSYSKAFAFPFSEPLCVILRPLFSSVMDEAMAFWGRLSSRLRGQRESICYYWRQENVCVCVCASQK